MSNLKEADFLNSQRIDETDAIFGITQFSGYTKEEFETNFMGLKVANSKNEIASPPKITATPFALAEGMDNLTLGAGYVKDWSGILTTPLKNQGYYCGACWAFVGIQQIESDAMRCKWTNAGSIASPSYPILSPQEPVDCANKDRISSLGQPYTSEGCDGGEICMCILIFELFCFNILFFL